MKKLEKLDLTHSFHALGPDFFHEKLPDPVTDPFLIDFNPDAAKLIALNTFESERKEFLEYFSGNGSLPGSQPLAMVYSGHQFGIYVPKLGDGRALLLGEIETESEQIWDICLKGCGPTRFARGFDGRATLRSSIREYLGGEAVHGLGIPSTRSLALIGIRELVYREIPEPGAVLVRLSDSHIRFGSFQYFYLTNQPEKVTRLADYVIRRHYPEIQKESDRYQIFFKSVVKKTARLIALWQSVGFIHGVMNTDNMAITGVTFDYGPFGFMDWFNPNFTPNQTDSKGRYAFGKQAEIGYWNLCKLGETLSHLIPSDSIRNVLEKYQVTYNLFYRELMGQKTGLTILDSEFMELIGRLFQMLYENQIDYTIFFRQLSIFPDEISGSIRSRFSSKKVLNDWLFLYRRLIDREDPDLQQRKEKMNRVNPRFILRNYLLQRAIDLVLKESDYKEIERLRVLLEDPYNDRPEIFGRYGIDPEFYASETPKAFLEMQLSCSA